MAAVVDVHSRLNARHFLARSVAPAAIRWKHSRVIPETTFFAGVQIPQLEYGAPDYEQYGEVCGSEGPDGGEWAC